MLAHHGVDIGLRHARKHLGWALDAAARPPVRRALCSRQHRQHVLTVDDPAVVQRRLVEAFDAFGGASGGVEVCGMRHRRISQRSRPPMRCSTHCRIPVIVVAPDGKVADANVAAEAFFEVSLPLLRRHILQDLVPFGSPLAHACRAGAPERCRGQRIQSRSRHAAQSRRSFGRSARRATGGAARLRGGDAAGAIDRRQDGSAAHPSRRGPFGDRARRHACARDQESAVRYSRRCAVAGAIGRG